MTWTIRNVELPQDPKEIRKRTIRVQQPSTVSGSFPDPTINQPTRFELTIKGYIWPRTLAAQLDEATKNAESENMFISLSEEVEGLEWISGIYSVTRSEIIRNSPRYESTTGGEVYEYNITFAAFADAGADGAGEEIGTEGDEKGAGFFDYETLGLDDDGNGAIGTEDLFKFFNNLLTWGASERAE